jgi:hypothetical protein
MNKPLKIFLWFIGSVIILALLFIFVASPLIKKGTKKHSPEQHITFNQGDLELKAFYSSPSKKGRKIFGELVPYNEVWRTGANEATTFTTNKDLIIDNQELPAGKYTLWTIPGENSWKVIFNKKMYGWGVKVTDRKASREPEYDALITEVPVSKSINVTENFSIQFSESPPNTIMILSWDNIVIPVKMQQK